MMNRAPPPGPGRYKRKFTAPEDLALRAAVNRHGTGDWSIIADEMPGRNARQCRERWNNYLIPGLMNLPWTPAEDLFLDAKFAEFGSMWDLIQTFFPSRSRNAIRNRWLARHRNLSRDTTVPAELPRPMPPVWSAFPGKPREGIEIAGFSLSKLVPIPIHPRGHPCGN
jgi:hypothetical protein